MIPRLTAVICQNQARRKMKQDGTALSQGSCNLAAFYM